VVGFSTLNILLADSGLAVLNEHAVPALRGSKADS